MTLRRRKYLARFRAAGGENPKEIETRRKLPPWLPARCFLVLFPVNLGWGSCRPFWPQPAAVSSVRGQRWAFVWDSPVPAEESRGGGEGRSEGAPPAQSTQNGLLRSAASRPQQASFALTFLFPDFFTHPVRTSPFSQESEVWDFRSDEFITYPLPVLCRAAC